MVTEAMKLKDTFSLEGKLWQSRDITLLTKVRGRSYGFSSNHVWM